MALEIKRQVAHLAGHGIHVVAGEPVTQVTGEQQVLRGFLPDLRLVVLDPVRLGLAAEKMHGFFFAGQREEQAPETHAGQVLLQPLIQPDNGGAQGLAVAVEIHHGGALQAWHRFSQKYSTCCSAQPGCAEK